MKRLPEQRYMKTLLEQSFKRASRRVDKRSEYKRYKEMLKHRKVRVKGARRAWKCLCCIGWLEVKANRGIGSVQNGTGPTQYTTDGTNIT